MCRVLEVSRSGYYAWLKRPPSQRIQEDEQLTNHIRTIYTRSKGTYGAPRIHAELISVGVRVDRKRVAGLMKAAHLGCKPTQVLPHHSTSPESTSSTRTGAA